MNKYYFVCFVICFTKINGLFVKNAELIENGLIANVISQFSEHNIIFHYDNITKNRIDSIIPKTDTNGSILLGNYDIKPHLNGYSALMRPFGYKFLHVILLEKYHRFIEYTNASRFSLHYLDIVLVITNKIVDTNETTSDGRFFAVYLRNTHRAGAFFILNLYNFIVYNVCFYCREKFGVWQEVIDLTELTVDYNPTVRKIFMTIYENQFKDFNGHVFPVGYAMYKPYFWCRVKNITYTNKNRIFEIYGSEGELLILLHEKLNFQVAMYEFNGTDGAWSSIIEAVRNGTLSWAVGGISTSYKRREIVEFTNYVNTEPYVALYSVYKNPWMSWRNIVVPFKMRVWLSLIMTITALSSLFFLTVLITKINLNIRFNYFFYGCLRLLVEQPIPIIYKALKTRWTTFLFMYLCLILAIIMTNAYKSRLTSALVNFKADEYNDIDELVKLNYEFFTSSEDSTVLQETFEYFGDEIFLKMLQNSRNDTELCSSIYQTIGNKKAVIDEETTLQYSIQEYCHKGLTLVEQEDLRIVKHALISNEHAWPMPLNTPYRNVFNRIISRLHAAGIIKKWNNDYAFLEQIVPKSNQKRSRLFRSSRNKVTIVSLCGPAFIWVIGLIIAFVVFIFEIICNFLK